MGHSCAHLDTEAAQVFGHQLRGPEFPIGKLRMFVQVTPPSDNLADDLFGPLVDLLLKIQLVS
jgi:hypothetical protein